MISNDEHLAWIDMETGGLCGTSHMDDARIPEGSDGARHYAILEIGVHVTDADLNVVDKGLRIVIFHCQKTLDARVGDWSREQFKNTLMVECQNPNHPNLQEAERMVIDYLEAHGVVEGTSPLCGNSIYLDRRYISAQMPALNRFLHYRQLDVSSVAEMVARWYPQAYSVSPEKKGSHEALGDIRESIEELRYYRDHCFV